MRSNALHIFTAVVTIAFAGWANAADEIITDTFPTAAGISVAHKGDLTALVFRVPKEPGYVGVALKSAELPHLISEILNQAAQQPARPPETEVRGVPIPVSQMGWAKGRTANEVFLAIRVGNINLLFAMDTALLPRKD